MAGLTMFSNLSPSQPVSPVAQVRGFSFTLVRDYERMESNAFGWLIAACVRIMLGRSN